MCVWVPPARSRIDLADDDGRPPEHTRTTHNAGKVWNPFADQTDPAFIEQRRQELEVYLRRLIQMPKVSTNPDLFRFFQLHPVTGVPLDPSDINQHVELKF